MRGPDVFAREMGIWETEDEGFRKKMCLISGHFYLLLREIPTKPLFGEYVF